MAFSTSIRSLTLASAAVAVLGLSACVSHSGGSRYGDCTEPCMQTNQPAYMESYYQVPVAPPPAPKPVPAPVYTPPPAPPVIVTPPPAISCPYQTTAQDDGTCLQFDIPEYIPPVIGYTPDPIAPPKVYTPIRK